MTGFAGQTAAPAPPVGSWTKKNGSSRRLTPNDQSTRQFSWMAGLGHRRLVGLPSGMFTPSRTPGRTRLQWDDLIVDGRQMVSLISVHGRKSEI